ncbi:MAG: TonB-dependent receptor [Sandarakinorhabdus sp.]|nr:TonB-dependent receptor [Sandarakinorhabdus sp.]
MAFRLRTIFLAGIRLGATASVLALATTSAYAQEVTGTIRGDVQDDAGNPVAGAAVVITHVPSGTRSHQTTDSRGSFSAPNLRVGGPFDVEVTAAGFDGARSTILSIQAGQAQRIAVVLVGEGATIEVKAGRAPSSIMIATGPATSLDSRDIAGIANVNRDIRNLAARDPFVSLDPTNGGAISIAGQNNRFNRITVDGLAFGDPFGLEAGGLASSRGAVPLDAIAEFTVETAPVDIQQGGFQGGAINTVLKSGGNDFDIGGFFTYSSDSLAGGRTRGIEVDRDFESRIYGAQITGPIIRDRLFFAVTWESLRDTTPSLTGPAGEGFANQLPITRAQVDQVSGIADTVYSYDTLDVARGVPEQDDKFVAKIDWNITDGHRAAFTYIYNKGNLLAGVTGAAQVTATNPTLALQSNNFDQGAINHYGVLQLNSQWSDSFSTQARISFHDYERLQVPFGGREFGQFQVCLDPVSTGALLTCPPGTGRIQFGPDISRQANELFVQTLGIELQARIRGSSHDLKIIAERRGQDINNLFAQRVSGAWYFDSIADLQARRANELDYGSPILGSIDSVRARFQNNVYTFGVQDSWDVNEDLTLVYGFRYDLYETPDRPLFNADFLRRVGFSNNSSLNGRDILQPRFGLTWRVDDRLRLRASAGLFAGGNPNVWISNSYSNPGPTLGRVQVRRTGAGSTFTVAGVTGLTTQQQNDIGAATLNGVSGGTGIPDILDQIIATSGSSVAPTNALDPDFQIPSQWRISGTVDYAANLGPLGDDWMLTGSVIWSRVKDALTWTDLRSIPNAVQATLPDGRLRYQGFDVASGTNTDIFLTNSGRGYSWNIVGRVDKAWDNGLSIGAAYTLQRAKDLSPGTSSVAFSNYDNTVGGLDPNNSAYGTSNYQIDDSLRLKLGYDAPLFGDNLSRIELFFTSRAGQRFSHTFADAGTAGRSAIFGVTGNDGRHLMYVPNVASATADPLVEYAPGFDFAGFQRFIQGSALNRHQGRIAPKNLGKSPRFNKLDLRISQEVPFFRGGRIELFGDVENLLNLLNSDWGSLRQVAFPYRAQIVNVQCLQAGGAVVTGTGQACARYQYSGFREPGETIFTNISIWQVRLGVRLQFRGL